MKQEDIINTYYEIQSCSTLKSLEILDFMKESAILRLKEMEKEVTNKKYEEIYTKLEEELLRLTGKKQKTDKISNKSYSFMPNFSDFSTKLKKTILKYKLSDPNKVEKTLINYINKCYKAQNWFPLLIYYLSKDNSSNLATDYFNEDTQQINNTNIINSEFSL